METYHIKEYMLKNIPEKEAFKLSPLVLAYIGDAVYELFMRLYVLNKGKRQVGKLHSENVELVKASTQANFLEILKPHLKKDESSIARRARNTRIDNCPRGMDLGDYRKATALEALFGYLYVSGKKGRLIELMDLMELEEE